MRLFLIVVGGLLVSVAIALWVIGPFILNAGWPPALKAFALLVYSMTAAAIVTFAVYRVSED